MTGLMTKALTGFFVYASLSGVPALASTTDGEVSWEPTYQSLHVRMTAYNAVPEQTDGNPSTTSIGAFADPDVVVARSKDLADELPYGTVIDVVPNPDSTDPNCGLAAVHSRIGYRVVADAMHPRKRNQVDILFDTDPIRVGGRQLNPAKVLGLCKDVEIRIIGRIDTSHMPKNQAELAAMMGSASLALSK